MLERQDLSLTDTNIRGEISEPADWVASEVKVSLGEFLEPF